MGYAHINNLYKDTTILYFRRCYALEKIHGTSANVSWKNKRVRFYSGGAKQSAFEELFNVEQLTQLFTDLGHDEVTIYGEAYGGKVQKMSVTYGSDLKFCAFEAKIGDTWLNVPNAEDVAKKLGLEFVHYVEIDADIEAIDAERDADSVQAIRNGMGEGKKREGVVLRPLEEFCDSRGNRVLSKHKCNEFMETATPRKVDSEKLRVLEEAEAIATEWVTDMRLTHVLDAFPDDVGIESTGAVIKAMAEDVLREAKGEIIDSKQARRAINKRCAKLFKARLQAKLYE
jgi:hypothetical protein